MWDSKVVSVTELLPCLPKVVELILGWLSTYMWCPVVAVLDEQELPREYGKLTDAPKTVAEILAVRVHAGIGEEFRGLRQNEKRIKGIRVGDTVRRVAWLEGELNHFVG